MSFQVVLNTMFRKSYSALNPAKPSPVKNLTLSGAWHAVSALMYYACLNALMYLAGVNGYLWNGYSNSQNSRR